MDLSKQRCIPCEGKGIPALNAKEIKTNLKFVKGWKAIKNHEITKEFKFSNFVKALDFVNKVGVVAEKEGHHPDLSLGWGYVKITLFTHAVKGLSVNDFVLAAKIDKLK